MAVVVQIDIVSVCGTPKISCHILSDRGGGGGSPNYTIVHIPKAHTVPQAYKEYIFRFFALWLISCEP